jgi:hypothetical protein
MSSTPFTENVSILEQYSDQVSLTSSPAFPVFPIDDTNIPILLAPVQLTAPDGNLVLTTSSTSVSSIQISPPGFPKEYFNQDITITPVAVLSGTQPQLPTPPEISHVGGISTLPDYNFYTYQTIPIDASLGGGSLSGAEINFSAALINSGALSSGTPFRSVMTFIRNHFGLFLNAVDDVSRRQGIQDEAQAATQAGLRPLDVFASGVAGGIGSVVLSEASAIGSAFGIGTFGADVIGTALVGGGFLHAYDAINGTHTLALVENRLGLIVHDLTN